MLFRFSGLFIFTIIVFVLLYTIFYASFVSEKNNNKYDLLDYAIEAMTFKKFLIILGLSVPSSLGLLVFINSL